MKIKLGNQVVKLNRIWKITRYSKNVACIRFKTGESIHVVCGVEYPSHGLICYPGTYEEFKDFITQHQ